MYLPVVNLYQNNQEPLGIFFEKLFENCMVSVDTSKCEEVAYSEWEIVMGVGDKRDGHVGKLSFRTIDNPSFHAIVQSYPQICKMQIKT